MVDATLLSKAKALSPAERIELMGELWESLSGELPISDAERNLLDQRLREADERPQEQSPWSEVERLLSNLGS